MIRDVDRGARATLARLRGMAAPLTLSVGVHEAEGAAEAEGGEQGTTVVDIANFAEFGTATEPPRSFIAAWVDENAAAIKADLEDAARAVAAGKIPTLEIAFERLGLKYVAQIQARIRAGIPPELAESTIEAKGSSTPLIDSGQLWSSILHQVVKGSGE